MTDKTPTDKIKMNSGEDLPAGRKRKPYEPPRILSREPLEAMAATCTPGPLTRGKANTAVCGIARS